MVSLLEHFHRNVFRELLLQCGKEYFIFTGALEDLPRAKRPRQKRFANQKSIR
jgi:hypothetical protein